MQKNVIFYGHMVLPLLWYARVWSVHSGFPQESIPVIYSDAAADPFSHIFLPTAIKLSTYFIRARAAYHTRAMNKPPPSVLNALEKAQRVDQRAGDMRHERSKRRQPRHDGSGSNSGAFEDVRSFLSRSSNQSTSTHRSATSKAMPTVTR